VNLQKINHVGGRKGKGRIWNWSGEIENAGKREEKVPSTNDRGKYPPRPNNLLEKKKGKRDLTVRVGLISRGHAEKKGEKVNPRRLKRRNRRKRGRTTKSRKKMDRHQTTEKEPAGRKKKTGVQKKALPRGKSFGHGKLARDRKPYASKKGEHQGAGEPKKERKGSSPEPGRKGNHQKGPKKKGGV